MTGVTPPHEAGPPVTGRAWHSPRAVGAAASSAGSHSSRGHWWPSGPCLGPGPELDAAVGVGGGVGGSVMLGKACDKDAAERGQPGGLGQHCRVQGPASSGRSHWLREGPGRPDVGVRQPCWAPGTRGSKGGREDGDPSTPPAGVGVLRCDVPSGEPRLGCRRRG